MIVKAGLLNRASKHLRGSPLEAPNPIRKGAAAQDHQPVQVLGHDDEAQRVSAAFILQPLDLPHHDTAQSEIRAQRSTAFCHRGDGVGMPWAE